MKKHIGFISFFTVIIFIFLGKLIFMKETFLGADYLTQFYPWSKIYSEAIKNFTFPFWIRYIGSGFPLIAEGQIGGFYPLNIIMFFLLPFNLAYNYSIVLHFILAGIFIYIYARKIGIDEWGGLLSAILFCFGSAYAGCFYTIAALRTLIWFPLVLFLFELYLTKPHLKHIYIAAIIFGMQFLAGYMQIALYCAFFYLLYFLNRARSEKTNFKKIFIVMAIFLTIAFVIALPQLLLTFQLAGFSNRQAATLGFALWGSFSPAGFLGVIFPYALAFTGSRFYLGIYSLFFIIFSFFFMRRQKFIKALIIIFLLSLFLALGKYNPLYVLILKLTGFYSIRNPSKFLFFIAFAGSILAGYGFSYLFANNKEERIFKKTLSVFRWMIISSGLLFLSVKPILQIFKKELIDFSNWYTVNFVWNRFEHRHSMDYYTNKIQAIYNNLINSFSFSNAFTIISWLFIIFGLLIFPFILKKQLKRFIIFLILLDLFVFSFYGIGLKNNIRPFSFLESEGASALAQLKKDKELFRILPFDIASNKLPNWSLPNTNIIYAIDSIACYSPLALKAYRDKLLEFEVVDDSLGLNPSNQVALIEKNDVLRLLNVKYIVAPYELRQDFLKLVDKQNETFLYQLDDYFPRVFFTEKIAEKILIYPTADIKIISYKDGFVEINISTDKKGILIFSEQYYLGWQAYVDGKRKEIIKIKDLIQGVAVSEGKHTVIFQYKPKFW